MSDILSKLNDLTFYINSPEEPKLIKVLRRTNGLNREQKQMIKKMTLKDFYNLKNNKLFCQLCPPLVRFDNSNYIGMWMNICIGQSDGRDFMVAKKSFGELLEVIAEIMTGDPISDRSGIMFNFGKPIELETFLERYRELVNEDSDGDLARMIVFKSEHLRKCCKYKTRGIGSIIKVINKIC